VKADAYLSVERRGDRDVVGELRCAPPLRLLPVRGATGPAVVHLVSSAAHPLGGDEVTLTVHVGAGASLRLCGVAATVALPGPGAESRVAVRLRAGAGASVSYLPEPTVITARACHTASLEVDLAGDACLHTREVLVLGRAGERPGVLTTSMSVARGGVPVVRQHLTVGDPDLDASAAFLAGKRVLATALHVDDAPRPPASGEWWSRTPLAAGGTLTTALADDAVTAQRHL
jgi:urease accessory protein